MCMYPACSLPIVQAVLKCGNVGWVWVVPQCPYCGDEHWHSGGPLSDDPYRFVGPDSSQVCTEADLGTKQGDSVSTDGDLMIYILQADHMDSV
jgi:hypothetical protein